MKVAFVNPNRCDASPVCPSRRSCPAKAITQEKLGFLRRGPAKVNTGLCTGCGTCIKMCPHGAISFKQDAKNKQGAKKSAK